MIRCPDGDTISAFASGRLSPDERAAAQRHVDECERCRDRLVSELAPPDVTAAESTASSGGFVNDAADVAALQPGDKLDGYVLLRPIDSGAMGEVWLADDPALNRQVAIKVLHGALEIRASRDAAGLLQREARSLAQLSHPNVVVVHAVAHAMDRDYIAMEYVAGVTLREWLAASKASLGERLDVLIQAGRGLAAAHAAGIVHRDFKPSNVLIGADGRVRVGDFGLARLRRRDDSGAAPASATARTTLAGTPAYMAPEQLRGGAATEAGDQYSFAVSLYEAVYGLRPFDAATPGQLADAIERDAPRPPRGPVRVPGWLRAIILRGLRADAAARFASVAELVDAIEARRRRRWLRQVAAAMVAVAAVTAAVAVPLGRRAAAAPGCDREGEQIARVWSPARAAAIRRQLEAVAGDFGAEQWQRAAPLVDAYATRWSAMRRETCEATRVRHVQSDSLFDRRMYCLDRRLAQLESTAASLGGFDRRSLVARAVEVASGLPSLDPCAGTQWLSDSPMPPIATRGAIDDAFKAIDAARSLALQGSSQEALEAFRALVVRVAALDYAPLTADLAFETAIAADDVGDFKLAAKEYERAGNLAAGLRRIDRVFEAQVRLSRMEGFHDRSAQALGRASSLEGLARLSPDPQHLAMHHENLGALYGYDGRYADAAAAYREALAALPAEAAGGLHGARAHEGLGLVFQDLGDYAASERELSLSLSVREEIYGPRHPMVARTLSNLGNVAIYRGQYARALEVYQRALGVLEAVADDNHPDIAMTLGNVAVAQEATGDYAGALATYERALALRIKAFGPEHPEVALTTANKGNVLARLGRYDEAEALITAAIAMRRKVQSSEHPDLVRTLSNLGSARLDRAAGSSDADARAASTAAIAPLTEALEIAIRKLGADHPLVGQALYYRARALLGAGRVPAAKVDAERALEIIRKAFAADSGEVLETTWGLVQVLVAAGAAAQGATLLGPVVKDPPHDLVEARAAFTLAEAWWQTGRRADAVALATRAADAFEAAPEAEARARARAARAWLRPRAAQ